MIEMLRHNADKFWARVVKGNDSECWLWQTWLDRQGYGIFQFRYNKIKKKVRASRVSYMLTHDCSITSDQFVCHTCDNPQCVNPSHFVLADNDWNIADCVAKGRQRHVVGEKHSKSKLTDQSVVEIRKQISLGGSQLSVAKKFGVSRSAVRQILSGATWKHVPSEVGR